jgi:hypothetical protein
MEEKKVVNKEGVGIGTVLTPGTFKVEDYMNLGGRKCFLNIYDWLGDPDLESK